MAACQSTPSHEFGCYCLKFGMGIVAAIAVVEPGVASRCLKRKKRAKRNTPPGGGGSFLPLFLCGECQINQNMIGIYFAQIWHHIQRLWKQDQLRSLLVPYLHNTAELSIPNFDPYLYMYIVNVLCVFNLRIISIHADFTKLVSQIECRRRTVMWMELTDKAMNKRHF